MTPKDAKALVRRLVTEAQQNGRLEVVDEILAPRLRRPHTAPGSPCRPARG